MEYTNVATITIVTEEQASPPTLPANNPETTADFSTDANDTDVSAVSGTEQLPVEAPADVVTTFTPAPDTISVADVSEPANPGTGHFLKELRAKYSQARQLHPKVVRMPAIDQKQFAAIVEDIRKHGQRLPILTMGGKIVDGEIREAACFVASVQPWYQEWDGEDDVSDLSVSLNVRRRQLTQSQLAAYIPDQLLAKEEKAAQTTEFATVRKPRTRTVTKNALAAKKGVSPRLVDQALKLKKEAPAELEKVRAGEKSLSEAVAGLKSEKKVKATRDTNPQPVKPDPFVTATELMSASANRADLNDLPAFVDEIKGWLNRRFALLDEADLRLAVDDLVRWLQAKLQPVASAELP